MRADNATLSRLRERAVYEVCVASIDRALLALFASEGFSLMREAVLDRFSVVSQPLVTLYSNAIIAFDVDATELDLRSLAGDTTVVRVCLFKCYLQQAVRNMLLLNDENSTLQGCLPHITGAPPTLFSQHLQC